MLPPWFYLEVTFTIKSYKQWEQIIQTKASLKQWNN